MHWLRENFGMEQEIVDASEIHARRLNEKEVFGPKTVKFLFSRSQMEQSSCLEKWVFRTSTLLRDQPERGEELRDDVRGESDGSQPTDTTTDDREAKTIFLLIEGNYVSRHHVEGGVIPIPLRYIDVIRRTHVILDVLQESRADDIGTLMDWFHAVHNIK